jgi:hypothetical protein
MGFFTVTDKAALTFFSIPTRFRQPVYFTQSIIFAYWNQSSDDFKDQINCGRISMRKMHIYMEVDDSKRSWLTERRDFTAPFLFTNTHFFLLGADTDSHPLWLIMVLYSYS